MTLRSLLSARFTLPVATVAALLGLAVVCRAELAPHPRLDANRLKRAYKLHRPGNELTVSPPTWSPDGRHAFFSIVEDQQPPTGYWRRWTSLFAVRRDGHGIRLLDQWENWEVDKYPSLDATCWSPDSSHVLSELVQLGASVNIDGIDLIDFDPETGKRRILSRDIDGKARTGEILEIPAYYSFSPDGKYLLMALGDDRCTWTNKRLVKFEYATGKRTVLTTPDMASADGRWSPDGKQIAYVAIADHGADSGESHLRRDQHLYVMTADGLHKRCLTSEPDYCDQKPTWSADGRTISFTRRLLTGDLRSRSLWTVSTDGSQLTRVRPLPPTDYYYGWY